MQFKLSIFINTVGYPHDLHFAYVQIHLMNFFGFRSALVIQVLLLKMYLKTISYFCNLADIRAFLRKAIFIFSNLYLKTSIANSWEVSVKSSAIYKLHSLKSPSNKCSAFPYKFDKSFLWSTTET